MKILLLGDIHANIVALQKVLENVGNVDAILCAGDLVDYNPWPLETIQIVKERDIQSVIGNHDRDSSQGTPIGYNLYAEISCRWTHEQLGSDQQRYLLNLPEKLALNIGDVEMFVCHGSPDNLVDEYVFPPPMTPRNVLREYLIRTRAKVLVLGHTHIPFIQEFHEGYVVNVGSVGQPRSGDPRACYVIMTVEKGAVTLEHRFIEYDVGKVATRIVEIGLPTFLAERLYRGI